MALFGTLNGILGAGGAAPSRWMATADDQQRFSDDFGATWSDDQDYVGNQSAVRGMPNGTWMLSKQGGTGTGLYRSTDNADTFSFENNFDSVSCNGFRADASGNWVAVGDGSKIKYSSDDGDTWTTANNPFTPSTIARVQGVTTNGSGDFICTGHSFNPGSGSRVPIAVSTDFGVTWTHTNTGVNKNMQAISHEDGVWITVGQDGMLLRSTDTGASWSSISNPWVTFGASYITDVAVFNGTWIIIGLDENEGATTLAISRSTDGGLTWSSFISNAATPNTSLGRRIDVDALGQLMIYYNATGGHKVIKSTDDGLSWGNIISTGNNQAIGVGDTVFSNNSGST